MSRIRTPPTTDRALGDLQPYVSGLKVLPRLLTAALVVCVVSVGLLGCGSEDGGDQGGDNCETLVQNADQESGESPSPGVLDGAIANCQDLASFRDATEKYPGALNGADAETFVQSRCAAGAVGPACAEVGE
jgi:uncharacterized lipoprotein YehR (DUF1307 family)